VMLSRTRLDSSRAGRPPRMRALQSSAETCLKRVNMSILASLASRTTEDGDDIEPLANLAGRHVDSVQVW